jgi:hypothetical protein
MIRARISSDADDHTSDGCATDPKKIRYVPLQMESEEGVA